MTVRKKINEGYQPQSKGYQPAQQKPLPNGDKVQGGYQPITNEAKPIQPPPKKP
jgi:hypothetical protein